MGREVRRVPADWEHPKDWKGHHIPLFGRSYEAELAEWLEGRARWAEGLREDWDFENDGPKRWKPIEADYADQTWEEWHGDAPQASSYMPDWPEAERTHWQMYETCTEGTPISPVMDDPDKLARWLADNYASAFGSDGATYEQWKAMIGEGWAVSAVMDEKGFRSDVAAMADLKEG